MNKFQKEVLKKHAEFELSDFIYFTTKVAKKVENKGLPKKECKINNYWTDNYVEFDGLYYRREYCLKNCGFRCLNKT